MQLNTLETNAPETKVHFVGIGGIGMSGLARLLLQSGCKVSGSDVKESRIVQELRQLGAIINSHHAAENVDQATMVVHTTDVAQSNPEVQEAIRKNIPLLHRSDLLVELTKASKLLAVTGTHGKTTTSSLLAHLLQQCGKEPSFAVGGIPGSLATNAQRGASNLFVIEADESDGTFLKYNYHSAIVTNVDSDHIAHFGSFEKIKEGFQAFIEKAPHRDNLLLCGEDPFLRQFAHQGLLYGFSKEFPLYAKDIRHSSTGTSFNVIYKSLIPFQVDLPLAGKHNVLNALAAIGIALQQDVTPGEIQRAIQSFKGVARRLEHKGVVQDILVVDDYGHHPTEVRATLQAFRQQYGRKKISVFFQPHRASRMKHILHEFEDVFDEADQLYITDLYSAGEPYDPTCTSQTIFDVIKRGQKVAVEYIPKELAVAELTKRVGPHEAILFFGAGDTNLLSEKLVDSLKESSPKLKVCVIYGGESSEHLVSCVSSRFITAALPQSLYEVDTVLIGTDGNWYDAHNVVIKDLSTTLKRYSLLFPVLHGPRGEDGRLQGFFEMLHLPYVGCAVLGAALAMDKARAKRVVESWGVRVVPWVEASQSEWQVHPQELIEQMIEKLNFPMIVKPSHLGSSVGVQVVNSVEELQAAIDHALYVDTEVVVEKWLSIAHELEIAVLGNDTPLISRPGEILTEGKVYDYAAKYSAGGMGTTLDASISAEVEAEAIEMVKTAYRALGATGLSRIDLLLDRDAILYFNESNPIPGFTAISMYPQMMKARGVDATSLMIALVTSGLERFWSENRTFRRQIALGDLCGKLCSV